MILNTRPREEVITIVETARIDDRTPGHNITPAAKYLTVIIPAKAGHEVKL